MTKPSKGINKRRSSRQVAYMRANLIDPDVGILGDCLVRDVSATGARLELSSVIKLPKIVRLKVQDDPHLRYCAVRWQRGGFAGVEFVARKAAATAEEDRALRLKSNFGRLDKRSGHDRRAKGGARSGKDRRSTADVLSNSPEV